MRRIFIACRVLEDELRALGIDETDVVWLEQGLHNEPDQLRARIQEEIDRADADAGIGTVILAYGRCGNGVTGLKAQRVRLVVPRAHDCIALMLGSSQRYAQLRMERPEVYYYSSGWNRYGNPPSKARLAQAKQVYVDQGYDDDTADYLVQQMEAWVRRPCRRALKMATCCWLRAFTSLNLILPPY